MIRPTPRAVVLFAAGVPVSLGVILTDTALWPFSIAYLGFAIAATGLDAVLAMPVRELRTAVECPPVFHVGEPGELAIRIATSDRGRGTEIEYLCDAGENVSVPGTSSTIVTDSAGTGIALPVSPLRRGQARIERIWFRWRGPMRLTLRQTVQEIARDIPIIPNIKAVRAAALRFQARDAFFGIKAQSMQGDGSEFESLRDYTPGLDPRSIDWKHSARHRAILCKEFRAERNHQIVLAFDTGHLMSEPFEGIPKIDHAINAALLLAYMSLKGGDRVGLFGFDSRVRFAASPLGGMQSFPRLQHSTSEIEYRYEETNFTLGLAELASRLNRRSLIVLMTEFVDTVTAELMVENIERMAKRHLVMFVTLRDPELEAAVERYPERFGDVTRSVIAGDFLREREIVFERLRRLGVHCLEAPSHGMAAEMVERYLAIKRQELI